MDKRVTDLEMKTAFLDDLVHSLSDTIYQQQKQIAELTEKLERLNGQVKGMQSDIKQPNEEAPPPHY